MARITMEYKRILYNNPLSSISYLQGDFIGYSVRATNLSEYSFNDNKIFKSLEKAEKEKLAKEEFGAKYPFICPRTERELKKEV